MGIDIDTIRSLIVGNGHLAILIILFMYAIKPIIVVCPIIVLYIAVGSVYPPPVAIVINIVGTFLSATSAFFIARFLGKDFVSRILRGKSMKFDENIEKHGFKILFLMRIGMIFPYDLTSYTAGFTKIKYKVFIAASVLGVVPEIISYAVAGGHIKNPLSIGFIAPLLFVILIAMVFSVIAKKQGAADK